MVALQTNKYSDCAGLVCAGMVCEVPGYTVTTQANVISSAHWRGADLFDVPTRLRKANRKEIDW